MRKISNEQKLFELFCDKEDRGNDCRFLHTNKTW